MRYFLAILVLTLGSSTSAWAEGEKQDKTFVGWRVTDIEFRSIHGSKTARSVGTEFVLGSYITDYVRVEGRLGGGLGDSSPQEGLSVQLQGYASWFMGAQYPMTDDLYIYGLYGFSFAKGKTSREDPKSFTDVSEKFYDSSFSVSYALGMDYEVTDNWIANFEFGRLHRDSQSKIRTLQVGLGIKYEF